MPSDYTQIRYEVDENIATITLHRPEVLNAFTVTMMHELLDAYDRIDADDDVRAVIVTGEGRAFCAGADLSSGGSTFDHGPSDGEGSNGGAPTVLRDGGGITSLRTYDLTKPIIAAINGPAVGVGITMTLSMDVRMAAEGARIGFVFARRGIVPEAASSWFLPRLVGISQAAEWVYTGRLFSASEAMSGGLVRSVHPAGELVAAARELAQEIVESSSAVSVALARQMMWRMLGAEHPMRAHMADSRAMGSRGRSADAREGVESFLEKRAAVFTDKVSDGLPELFPGFEAPTFS